MARFAGTVSHSPRRPGRFGPLLFSYREQRKSVRSGQVQSKVGGLKALLKSGDAVVNGAPRDAGLPRRVHHRAVKKPQETVAQRRWQSVVDAPKLDPEVEKIFWRVANRQHGTGFCPDGVRIAPVGSGMTNDRVEREHLDPGPSLLR